jgi:inosose dehydratase
VLRIGVQTISWGEKVRDVSHMLREVRQVGYDGVELAQSPAELPGVSELLDLLESERLVILGIAGGSLRDRLDYVGRVEEELRSRMMVGGYRGETSPQPRPYVYVDGEYSEDWNVAFRAGVRLALHPHMFKPVQTAHEAEVLLRQHPTLELLPDTAHLQIAGSDPLEFIKSWEDRLAAIHLKDWSPLWGRSYPFYARGFCELGQGTVDLVSVLEWVGKRAFQGWVVVEQDYSNDPAESARVSLDWLGGVV